MQYHYRIDPEIFTKFPDYQRGIVLAFEVENGDSSAELIQDIRTAEEELRSRLDISTILEEPNIAAWREAYRLAGFKPSQYRPSVEGLVRRVLRGDALPTINRIVDIGTLLSIKYLVPIGAHAIDKLQNGLILHLANGSENFEVFGAETVEHPDPGEIVFCDGDIVITRRWTWRQAKHTLIEPHTSAVEFNIDALSLVSTEKIQNISQETTALLEKYCHAKCSSDILNQSHIEMAIK
jgi:DNA/RNA-binding domain of Phe-tRNA-synthetase-like protein